MKLGDKIRTTKACPTGAYQAGEEGLVVGIAADGDNQRWCFEVFFPGQNDSWYVDESSAEVIEHAKTH